MGKINNIAPDLAKLAVEIDAVQQDKENARRRTDANVAAIRARFDTFGQQRPLLVFRFRKNDRPTVISGNGGLLAAKSLGWTKVAVSHFMGTSTQARAYAIADNRSAELSEWDAAVLGVQVEILRASQEVNALLDALDLDGLIPSEEASVEEDDAIPEPPQDPVAKTGDIWICGEHRVICGDATDPTDHKIALGGAFADCVWTDPPYNVAYEGSAGTIKNDALSDEAFAKFLAAAFGALASSMRPGAPIYVAHPDTGGFTFRKAFIEAGFKLASCLIWRKNAMVLSRGDYHWQHEPILYGWKSGAPHSWFGGRALTTVVEADRPSRSAEHPTMKPLWLIAQMLSASATKGAVVFDPFGGSGSTLMACEALGMRCSTIEIDPKFVDVIVARWERKSGIKATRE